MNLRVEYELPVKEQAKEHTSWYSQAFHLAYPGHESKPFRKPLLFTKGDITNSRTFKPIFSFMGPNEFEFAQGKETSELEIGNTEMNRKLELLYESVIRIWLTDKILLEAKFHCKIHAPWTWVINIVYFNKVYQKRTKTVPIKLFNINPNSIAHIDTR